MKLKKEYFKQAEKTWADPSDREQDYQIRRKRLVKMLEPQGKIILDSGCGHGRFLVEFEGKNAKIILGADINLNNLKICQQKVKESHLVLTDLDHLPFRSGNFDIILCTRVVEHLDHPDTVFKEFGRISRKHTSLFVAWNHVDVWRIWDGYSRMRTIGAVRDFIGKIFPRYRKFRVYRNLGYSYRTIRQLQQENGFNIVQKEKTGTCNVDTLAVKN